ncbi:hypothetical protein BABINDRAFT_163142 [Babjeviella inositovora NRRL Y-12698]|uniref:AB hydrolase-1 domain-containing protein n=1 Tax=Babjeviella inositovora NRRL Y-12698 TaxID=984486 RepID=A0A1E3QKI7_9ASCO|nr:uncharacterized protein BABINDRAFT_163142 [Babjeviella inositovora NRRL Y-12698]ODQ78128.1 hypothetical protein BABINDRAFT_163142 [Babjeviella inositovora NRRL Y-12698]
MTVIVKSSILAAKKLNYTMFASATANTLTPVVFIHGLGSSQNFYHHIASKLTSETGRSCLLFDNEGAARSPLTEAKLDVAGMASNALGLLRELAIEQCILVGHSMGGMLVNYLLAHEPALFRGAVLVGPVHPTKTVGGIFGARIASVLEANSMFTMANTVPFKALGNRATSLHRSFVRELLLAQPIEGYAANCRVIQHAGENLEEKFVEWYKCIKHPVLILQGEQDLSAPWANCVEIIAQNVENVAVTKMPRIGHWHCIEACDEVYTAISAFVQKL